MDLLEKAREFAVRAHGDQRYGNDESYSVHLDEVVGVLREFGYAPGGYEILPEDTLVAAYLHDVLEDTKTTAADLVEAGFSTLSIAAVQFATDLPGSCRKEKKRATYAHAIRIISGWETGGGRWTADTYLGVHVGVVVKVADRIANLRHSRGTDLMRMYLREGETFRLAYYSEDVCEAMWKEYDRLMEEARTSR